MRSGLSRCGVLALIGVASAACGDGASDDPAQQVVYEVREFSYDDGRGDSAVPDRLAGNAFAVRFTAPDDATLDGVRFRLSDDGVPDTAFGLWILAAGADGSPGEPLHPLDGEAQVVEPNWQPDDGLSWVDVELSGLALAVSGDFFVVMEWLVAAGPDLKQAQRLVVDMSDPDDRTWLRLGDRWVPIRQATGFPNGDAIVRARLRVPQGSLPDEPTVVSKASPECRVMETLTSLVGDEGALLLVRLQPSAAPFDVDAVRLQMAHLAPLGGDCDVTVPFDVELFRGAGALPPERPELIERFSIERDATSDYPFHQLLLEPAETVRLEAGETLFVAVHMEAAADDARTCVNVCTDPVSSVSDAWSYASAPPYEWVLLSDLGLSLDADVDLIGTPVE